MGVRSSLTNIATASSGFAGPYIADNSAANPSALVKVHRNKASAQASIGLYAPSSVESKPGVLQHFPTSAAHDAK
jgi:hypothetical protein